MTKDSTKKTHKEKMNYEEEYNSLKEQFLRLQAEFANYKKRNEQITENSKLEGMTKVITKLLNTIDNFELALRNKDSGEEFVKGMELIFAQIIGTCEELGLEKIKTEGEEFDPKIHEVLLTEKSDKKENEIIEEFQSGYKFKDIVLRPARVKVSKK